MQQTQRITTLSHRLMKMHLNINRISSIIKKPHLLTSYKFYWGGIADFKVLASNLALNVSIGNHFEIPNKTYM